MSDGKLEKLNSLTEAEFREKVLMKLIPSMDGKQVRLTHGIHEHGKDITFYLDTEFGKVYYAVIAKKGKITASADGSRLTQSLQNIKNQIEQAFDMRAKDVTDTHSENARINQVIVWTTGSISDNATDQILSNLDKKYQNVRFRDGQNTVELLDQYFPTFFKIGDADVASYFDKARIKYSQVEEAHTLGSVNNARSLPSVFVEPDLEVVNRSKRQNNTRREVSETINFRKFVDHKSNAVITGDMGTGKSTLLRRILLRIIENNENQVRKYPIPVLSTFKKLNLRETKPLDVQREQIIENAIKKEYESICSNGVLDNLEIELEQGNILVLLDGLDELETEEQIQIAMNVVRIFADKYPKTRIIITSRILDFFKTSNLFSGFKVYRLDELTRSQIKTLISNWFGENSEHSKRLLNLISKPITRMTIPATPLALAIVAVLYENGKQDLPANLTELFKKYTELSLGRWDLGKSIKHQIDYQYKEFVLRRISWQMMDDEIFETSLGNLIDLSDSVKTERGLNYDPQLLVNETLDRSGLLIRNEKGFYEFKHRAFMDYFAGHELNSRHDVITYILRKFGHPSWSRVIFFASGLNNESDTYLKAVMENPSETLNDSFLFGIQLGLMAQATYMAPQEIKRVATQQCLWSFVDGWNSLASNLVINPEEEPHDLPHLIFLLLYSSIVRASVGSSTLSMSMSELVDAVLEQEQDIHKLDENEFAKAELFIFSLAISCANAENISGFISLFESELIKNPAYAVIGNEECHILLNQDLLQPEDKVNVKALQKRLKRKISNNGEFLDKLMNIPPLLLGEDDIADNLRIDWFNKRE